MVNYAQCDSEMIPAILEGIVAGGQRVEVYAETPNR
ncbi:hypothetical protein DSM3645_05934 [Blastopirellula marina DSM 3645]|uniref:Uncharacterized protein n=1 Tax=Blastopirellula marina DSM 3645 TaxID=314230 RepID=A4A036_9BACT|nr:hypothetical protein DSM3645_05934 [Blastopirellula marina DSM 3645]